MNAPVFDEIENSNNTGKIIPIYPLTFSLTQNTLRKIIENGLQKVQEQGGLPETLPDLLYFFFIVLPIFSEYVHRLICTK